MRNTFALAFVVALASLGACAWGDGSSSSDDSSDSSDSTPIPDAPPGVVCGDGSCAPSETTTCAADCGTPPVCNNNHTCDSGETTANCAGDCPAAAVCGDTVCDAGETTATCPGDCPDTTMGTCPTDPNDCLICAIAGTMCPPGLDMNSCLLCQLGGGGGLGACTGGTPDGTCDANETAATCPLDCM